MDLGLSRYCGYIKSYFKRQESSPLFIREGNPT